MTQPLSLNIPFENTFVINYDGDTRRWNRFVKANPWGDIRLHRFPTINPRRVPRPRPWKGDDRQWCRTRALQSIFEHCLNAPIPTGMIVEDDATFRGFDSPSLRDLRQELPADWELLVLGGRHAHRRQGVPIEVSPNVYRPYSVAQPSALAWRGYPILKRLYEFYLRCSSANSMSRDFCEIRRPESYGIYVPADWLFDSDHTGPSEGASWFYDRPLNQTVVSVLAGYRGGSSCVAGVIHQLGVSMGETLAPPDPTNPTGYFECLRLARICHRACHHPSLARRMPQAQVTGLLRQWAYERQLANPDKKLIGAKFPSLCVMGNEISKAWPNSKMVVVERPAEAVVASIQKTPWGWSKEEAEANHTYAMQEREKLIATKDPGDVFRLSFAALREETDKVISELVSWLNISPSPQQLQAALSHVRR